MWERHIADSAQLLEHVPRETYEGGAPGPWLDLGTGPGLPGLVIAILRPTIPVVLVESRGRRIEFLESCVGDLGLGNCEVIGERLERVSPFETWVISARAFAPLGKTPPLILTLLHKGDSLPLAQGALSSARIGEYKAVDSADVSRETFVDR